MRQLLVTRPPATTDPLPPAGHDGPHLPLDGWGRGAHPGQSPRLHRTMGQLRFHPHLHPGIGPYSLEDLLPNFSSTLSTFTLDYSSQLFLGYAFPPSTSPT